jgi:hypothetical protein
MLTNTEHESNSCNLLRLLNVDATPKVARGLDFGNNILTIYFSKSSTFETK